MSHFNISNPTSIEQAYDLGLLPQRNQKNLFYQETSCRSVLNNFNLSSENRRIIKKTENFTYKELPLSEFLYTPAIQKQIHLWIKNLNWVFPTSSLRTIFTNHIFNYLTIWYDQELQPVAYLVSYVSPNISHAAYLFYNPDYSHHDLPIRIVLQLIINSAQNKLKYAYLGRFSKVLGYYKRNFPSFEYFQNNKWQTLKTLPIL